VITRWSLHKKMLAAQTRYIDKGDELAIEYLGMHNTWSSNAARV